MFYGRPRSEVNITVKTPKGSIQEVGMIRNFNSNGAKEVMAAPDNYPPIDIKILQGNIGYIRLNSFIGGYVDSINNVFNSHLPQLRECKGLIIDVRGNRGGTDQAWENIAFHLLPDAEFSMPLKFFSRMHIAAYKNWGQTNPNPKLKEYFQGMVMQEIDHSPYINNVVDSLKLRQPLIIISGQHVASAAEDFLLLMKGSGRGLIVGEPSVGCVGEPMFFPIPGNLEAMMCVKKFVNLDSTQPKDGGILPDIFVQRDYEAYLKGKDNILDRGIMELTKLINK